MSNDYFNNSSPFGKSTLARSAAMNSALESIASGFDKLPGELPLQQDRVTYVTDTGSANVYAVALTPTLAGYVDGTKVRVKIANTNTGASTLEIESLGQRSIKRANGTDVAAGDLTAGDIHEFIYDASNTQFCVSTPLRGLTGPTDVLGTVSESGGVPTGSIMEVSTGSNGDTYRFANGLQICTHLLTLNYSDVHLLQATWTYPTAFNSRPTILPSLNGSYHLSNASNSIQELSGPSVGTANSTTAVINLHRQPDETNFGASDTSQVYLGALGRWYNIG